MKKNISESAENDMRKLANYKMPFGKYKGVRLMAIPEDYYIWFSRKNYPAGELGRLMKIAYEMKLNGLDHLLDPLISPDN